jgi:hypothetical protein
VEDFAITMDEWIRIGLSQLRGIKGCELNRTRCLRKATPEEQETLEEVMGYLVEIDLEDGKQQSGGSTGDMSQALVPYTCATSAEHVEASSQQKRKFLLWIWKWILQRSFKPFWIDLRFWSHTVGTGEKHQRTVL